MAKDFIQAKKLENDLLEVKDVICNICGSKEYKEYLKYGDKRIVVCKTCKALRTFPYPVIDYTKKDLYCGHYLKNEQLFRGFAKRLIGLILKYKRVGKFLDIGSAVGFLLEEARINGFNVEGIELNKEAIDISKKKGFIINTSFEVYNDSIFDVIVANHILEHIIEPCNFLKDVSRLLKKGGILVIGVPNHNSLVAKLYRKNWYGWGLPEHIWHFDRNSLSFVLSKTGFRIKELIQNSQHYPISKSLRKNTKALMAAFGNILGAGDQLIAIGEAV